MAIATIEKSKDLREATSALISESPCEAVMAYPLPFGPDEAANGAYAHESLAKATGTSVSVAEDGVGFLTSLLGKFVALHDWLAGPPMSNQDCVNVRLIRARDEQHWQG